MKITNWIVTISIVLAMTIGLMACKTIDEDTKIAKIIDNEKYIGIHKKAPNLYHIFIDDKNNRAYGWEDDLKSFVKEKVDSPSYTEHGKHVYWTEDGAYIDDNRQGSNYLELTKGVYFDAIKKLNLTVKDVKKSNYKCKVENKKDLETLLQQDILSIANDYDDKIKCVEIAFDKDFRPIKVSVILASSQGILDKSELKKYAGDYTHWFTYDIDEERFNSEFNEIKNLIKKWDIEDRPEE